MLAMWELDFSKCWLSGDIWIDFVHYSFSIYIWPKKKKLRHQNMNWNSLQIGKILQCWRQLFLRGVEGGHLLIILYEIVTFDAKKFLITSWFLRKKFLISWFFGPKKCLTDWGIVSYHFWGGNIHVRV